MIATKVPTKVGAITQEQYDRMTNTQIAKVIPACWRPFFQGKSNCSYDGSFYLFDGGRYCITTGEVDGWRD
jgi:hypothetical protein